MRTHRHNLSINAIFLTAALVCVNGPAQGSSQSSTTQTQHPIIWHKAHRHIDPKTGYRTSYYRARVPETVPGGTRITLQDVIKHHKEKTALFLDVMAHTGTGPDPIDGHWRLSQQRKNIPGSLWLPDVGTGTLSKPMTHYFQTNLEKLTKGNKAQAIIIYCTADCWMAWNAVRRAASYGYTNLLWYPEGTEDWQAASKPLTNATPVPLQNLE